MNKRLISIIIAVVMALLAVVMINTYLTREKQKYQIEHEETYVVVANQDIPKGATITPSMLAAVKFPVKYLQPKAIQNPNAAVGKTAVADIVKGEQVLDTKLTVVRRVDDSLAVRLPKGKRAFNIRFEDYQVTTVGDQVKVGDYVDIIGIFPYANVVEGKTVTENVSVTLFQNILVMGIINEGGGRVVFTFALTPEESAILTYARTQGTLRLVLRHPLDTTIEPVPPVEANVLWQYILNTLGQPLMQPQKQEQQPQQQSLPEAPPTLEIYKGTQREEMKINN